MDGGNDDSPAKEQQEIDATTERGTDEGTEMKNTEGDKVRSKRAGEPSPTAVQPDLKKQKLEEQNTKATPHQPKNNASRKQEKKQFVFAAPKTPPGTSKVKSTAHFTPPGQPPRPPNPIYTPSRPKGVSRLIKDEDVLPHSTDTEDAEKIPKDNESVESESESDSDWEFNEELEEEFEEEYEEDLDWEIEENDEQDFKGETEGDTPKETAGEMAGKSPEKTLVETPEQIPEDTKEDTPEKAPEQIPEKNPEETAEENALDTEEGA